MRLKLSIARYILLKIEQKKIETKLAEIAQFYDNDSLRTLFEPIGESMMVIGLIFPVLGRRIRNLIDLQIEGATSTVVEFCKYSIITSY